MLVPFVGCISNNTVEIDTAIVLHKWYYWFNIKYNTTKIGVFGIMNMFTSKAGVFGIGDIFTSSVGKYQGYTNVYNLPICDSVKHQILWCICDELKRQLHQCI